MPSPTKKSTAEKNEGLLNNNTQKKKTYSILLVGPAKSGKTYFACSWPKPLIINTDFGLTAHPGIPSFDVHRPLHRDDVGKQMYGWVWVKEILENLQSESGRFWDELKKADYIPQTIVLDSVSALTDIMEAEISLRVDRKGKLQIQDYDEIKIATHNLVSLAVHGLPQYNFIATMGLDYRDDDKSVFRAQPLANGRKLGPSLTHYFDDVYLCGYERGKWTLDAKPTPSSPYLGTRSGVPWEPIENPTYDKIKDKLK